MKLPIIIGLFMLLAIKEAVNGQSINQNDGPYIFYKDSLIYVATITSVDGQRHSNWKIAGNSKKEEILLSVNFSNHPNWNFKVPLKKEIKPEKSEYVGGKILALSDIEGEFESFRNLLLANNVIDVNYNWSFGKGQLVICGDVFDFGHDVTACLWLIYKLEEESNEQGGYVHLLLGEHDIMNLSGEILDVHPRYFDNAKLIGKQYMDIYAANTELGYWLRNKNIIEKIGSTLFLHGGIASEINTLRMSLENINRRCRLFYDKAPFYDLEEDPYKISDKEIRPFFSAKSNSGTSPFWYRGYFLEPKALENQIDSTLNLYHCTQIVVGHTIIDSNLGMYYHGKVFGIDGNEHEGKPPGLFIDGLLIENGNYYKVTANRIKKLLK